MPDTKKIDNRKMDENKGIVRHVQSYSTISLVHDKFFHTKRGILHSCIKYSHEMLKNNAIYKMRKEYFI